MVCRDGFEGRIRGIVGNCLEGWIRLEGRMRGIFPRDGLEGQIRSVLPSANLVWENIGSVYPFYDGNRPLAPILRQRRCSLLYDVY
jgi:hypothetical protein